MDTKKLDTGSRDAISFLPEEILGDILSLLQIKQAVSTSVLSKNWRNTFRLVDYLDFNNSVSVHPENGEPERGESLRKFLDRTQGDSPIKKFSLERLDVEVENEMAYVGSWIRDAVEHGVLEVDVSINTRFGMFMPCELFTSKTLVKLTLGTQVYCELPSYVLLPSLKILIIETIFFESKDLSDVLLAGCPVLEELFVRHEDMEVHPYYISSRTITKLSVQYRGCDIYYESGLSFEAPSLVSFDYSGHALYEYTPVNFGSLLEARLDIRYKKAVKPDISGLMIGISNIETLHLSPSSADTISRCVSRHGLLLPIFNNLVSLSFGSNNERGWKLLPHLLKKSPKLETLIIRSLNVYISDHIRIPLNQVKVLHILGYQGTVLELKHLKSFIGRMQCVELVRLELAEGVVVDDGKILQIHRDLNHASWNCSIQVHDRSRILHLSLDT